LFVSTLFLTELWQSCNGLVLELLELLKPSSSYLTWNSKELEQNKASVMHNLICQQNVYELNQTCKLKYMFLQHTLATTHVSQLENQKKQDSKLLKQ